MRRNSHIPEPDGYYRNRNDHDEKVVVKAVVNHLVVYRSFGSLEDEGHQMAMSIETFNTIYEPFA